MNQNIRVVSIKDLIPDMPPCVAVVGRVTKVFPLDENAMRGNKPQPLQKFIMKDEGGSVAVALYGDSSVKAATLFHGGNLPVIRIMNFDVKKNTGGGDELCRIFSQFDWKRTKTQIDEAENQSLFQDALIQSVNPIEIIKDYEINRFTDVLGVLSATSPTKKTATNQTVRDISIYDSSGAKVTMTLWNNHAVQFTHSTGIIISARGAKVNKYLGGTRLSVGSYSTLQINPSTTAAKDLRNWDQEKPDGFEFLNISEPIITPATSLTIGDIHADKTTTADRKIKAIVQIVLLLGSPTDFTNHFYDACPKKACHKGVKKFKGQYRCEKCQKWYPNCTHHMKLPVELADATDAFTTTIFQKYLEKIIPLSANSLYLLSKSDTELYKTVLEHYLRNQDFEATVLIKTDKDKRDWQIQQFSKVNPAPENAVDVNVSSSSQDANTNDVENFDELNPHLGIIDECDGVPAGWRENRNAKQ